MSRRKKIKKTALRLACEEISRYYLYRDERQTPDFWEEFFKNEATIPEGMNILNQLKDWIENNGDKKQSSWDFIKHLLIKNGIEVE
ncbi:MAG: hypothetical protein Q4E88_02885 [Coriobacteriia bacterium]|nr:hypothetical protein [Coriobacteriia bacterium]